jgi:hypothetical protein
MQWQNAKKGEAAALLAPVGVELKEAWRMIACQGEIKETLAQTWIQKTLEGNSLYPPRLGDSTVHQHPCAQGGWRLWVVS